MNNIVLKPCPFCGGSASFHIDIRFVHRESDFPKWYVRCDKCFAKTATDTAKKAAELWNIRTMSEEDLRMEDDLK